VAKFGHQPGPSHLPDEAFESLSRAYDARSYLLVEYLNTDSRLDNLHDDPRFSALRNRVGLPAPGQNKVQ
jgi:hypothetical protein